MTLVGTSGILDSRTLSADDMGAGNPVGFFGWTVTGDSIVSIKHDLDGTRREGIDDFRYGTLNIAAPIPAALWLFCSGLIGLLGLAGKRK